MTATNGRGPDARDVLDRLDVEAFFAAEWGRPLRGSGDERSVRCPYHDDSRASMSVNVSTGRRRGRYYCHAASCGARGDVFSLWKLNHGGGSFPEVVKAVAQFAGMDVAEHGSAPTPAPERERAALASYRPDDAEAPAPEREIDRDLVRGWRDNLLANPERVAWLKERRLLTDATIAQYEIGWDGARYTIPVYDESGVLRNLRRYAPDAPADVPKMVSWRPGFGSARLYPLHIPHDGPLMVCAGEWDTLLARQLGFAAFTSTAGEGEWRDGWSARLGSNEVILALDHDTAGRQGTAKVARSLRQAGATVLTVDWSRWEPATRDDAPAGYDLTDAVRDGLTPDDVPGLVVDAPDDAAVGAPEPAATDGDDDRVGDGDPTAGIPSLGLYTDAANARRVVARYGHLIRHHPAHGWLVYEGGRWRPGAEARVQQLVTRTAWAIPREVEGKGDDARKRILRHAVNSLSGRSIRGTMFLLQGDDDVALEAGHQFDADLHVLNVRNGTLDLRTGALRPHDPADYCLKQSPVEYDPEAQCPRFERFLLDVQRDNAEMVAYIQKALGYALTGAQTEDAVFVLWGGGRNGKTTLLEMVLEALGDYATGMNFGSLTSASRPGASEDIARLAGRRLVKSVEAEKGGKWNMAKLKEMAGGDSITARFLFRNSFTFTPQFKLFLAVNDKPRADADDEAFWARMRLIPFTAEFSNDPDRRAAGARPAEDRDALKAALRAELPGILAWAVRGCLAWQREGLGSPPEVREATQAYRAENDELRAFLAERCVVEEGADVGATELYEAYREWCEARDDVPVSLTSFGKRLTALGHRRTKTRTSVRRDGLRLRDLADEMVERGEEPTVASPAQQHQLPDDPPF